MYIYLDNMEKCVPLQWPITNQPTKQELPPSLCYAYYPPVAFMFHPDSLFQEFIRED